MPWFNFPFIAHFSRVKQALSYVQWQNIPRIPKSALKYVLPGVPLVGFAGTWAYVRYQQNQLISVIDKINGFHDATVAELEGSSALLSQDKLYLMGEVSFGDLQQHRDTRYKITEYNKVVNQLREELSQFNWLTRVESFPGINSFLSSSLSVGSSIDQAHLVLNLSATALKLTDCFNWTLYHLKRRLYEAANRANAKALKMLEQDSLTQNCFKQLSQAALFAHAYNLAAKIARSQNNLTQSDQYYEQAKSYAPNDPVIIGSQIALWGDMAWDKDFPVLKKVAELVNNPVEFAQLRETLQGYGLGLANLSWALIRAVENQEKLALSEDKRQWCLQEAFKLADEAVPLLEQQPKSKRSVNARLFRGIIYMKQAKQSQQPEQYQLLALADFNAGLKADPDHPSLLRRRAMALQELGDPDTYAALQKARIELHYRLTHGEGSGRYRQWLTEIENQFLSGTPVPAAYSHYQQIISHLTHNEYQAAYRLLQQLPNENELGANIQAWINRHFKVYHNQLIPKAYEDDLLRFNLYQNPTPYEFMALSAATYAAKHGQPLGLPSGWEELCRSSQTHPASLQSGYLAVAYRQINTGQIIIGHGGTDWTDPKDLITDVKLAFGRNYAQLSEARQFTEQVLQLAEPEEAQKTIYHTGHSLGGMIAGYMACTSAPIGHHYAVTFDSPSSWRHLDQAYYNQLIKGLLPRQYGDFPVTAYLTRPSFINCAGGQHLGRALRIQIQLNPVQSIPDVLLQRGRQWLVDYIQAKKKQLPADVTDQWVKIVTANLACHDKDLIQAAFSHQDAKEIYSEIKSTYYVSAWPQDVGQWLEFEKLIASLQQNPLTYIPHENAETRLKALYALIPIKQVNATESYEIIPLSSLESGLQELLKNLLTKQPLRESQEPLKPYIDPDILAGLTWDEAKQVIQIKLPLSGWDLLTYLRQQVQEACQQEELAIGSVLYPHLERLPRQGFVQGAFYHRHRAAQNHHREPVEQAAVQL